MRRSILGYQCTYCGDTATTKDHFPPASYCLSGWLLPACSECNCFAGTAWPIEFEYRANHVKRRLREKYHRVLRTPDWSSEELAELGPNLRNEAIRWVLKKRHVQERLAWSAVIYLDSIDHHNVFAAWRVETETTTWNEKRLLRILSGGNGNEEIHRNLCQSCGKVVPDHRKLCTRCRSITRSSQARLRPGRGRL